MKTVLSLLFAAGLTASVLLTSGCGGQVDAATPLPKGETRANIQRDYAEGVRQVDTFYRESYVRIVSLHRKGLIGDGTAQRQLVDLSQHCTARRDAITEACADRMAKFDE